MLHARQDYQRIQDPENKIPEDEPVFLLRAKDELAPGILVKWSEELIARGGDRKMAQMVTQHSVKMVEWQSKHGCKLPDLPESAKTDCVRSMNPGPYENMVNITINDQSANVAQEIAAFKTLMERFGKQFNSHLELGQQFSKFTRFVKHFEKFENKEQEESELYPTFELYHTIKKNQHHSHHQKYDGKTPIAYRVLEITNNKGEYGVESTGLGRNFHFQECNFFIKKENGELLKIK